MSDQDLAKAVETTTVFAKLSPDQKARIILSLKENGHKVGYMGDGINDAPINEGVRCGYLCGYSC